MRQGRVITLLTDFGNQDAYVGIMKGVITRINPSANIIDICHANPPQDIMNGAYLLFTSYKYFPRGTIHVAVIDPGVGSARGIVCVETHDYLFLVPNNGLLSFIAGKEKPERIIQVTNRKYFLPAPSNTFHGRDIFAPVAAHLSLGLKPRQLGTRVDRLECFDIPKPHYKRIGHIEATIISVDRFGNLITSITGEDIEGLKQNQKDIEVTVGKKKLVGLQKTYTDVKAGKPLALLGSTDFLEISVNQGDAQRYFGVKKGDTVCIRLLPRKK
ncbi:MAG: hypothetical protein E3K32_09255 [wastewater metagenome]|nr:hypothetical protein [Candidatus Loosdrechtia aerotolerans]